MENLGNAIANCVDMMKKMHDSQQAPAVHEIYGLRPAMPMRSFEDMVNVSPANGGINLIV